jgi:transposase
MAMRYSDEFRRDAVRIATTSGLTRPKVASDIGIGLSTLNKWVQKHPLPDRALCNNVPKGRTTTLCLAPMKTWKRRIPGFAEKSGCCARSIRLGQVLFSVHFR